MIYSMNIKFINVLKYILILNSALYYNPCILTLILILISTTMPSFKTLKSVLIYVYSNIFYYNTNL